MKFSRLYFSVNRTLHGRGNFYIEQGKKNLCSNCVLFPIFSQGCLYQKVIVCAGTEEANVTTLHEIFLVSLKE
jgi:hypothetical protein